MPSMFRNSKEACSFLGTKLCQALKIIERLAFTLEWDGKPLEGSDLGFTRISLAASLLKMDCMRASLDAVILMRKVFLVIGKRW